MGRLCGFLTARGPSLTREGCSSFTLGHLGFLHPYDNRQSQIERHPCTHVWEHPGVHAYGSVHLGTPVQTKAKGMRGHSEGVPNEVHQGYKSRENKATWNPALVHKKLHINNTTWFCFSLITLVPDMIKGDSIEKTLFGNKQERTSRFKKWSHMIWSDRKGNIINVGKPQDIGWFTVPLTSALWRRAQCWTGTVRTLGVTVNSESARHVSSFGEMESRSQAAHPRQLRNKWMQVHLCKLKFSGRGCVAAVGMGTGVGWGDTPVLKTLQDWLTYNNVVMMESWNVASLKSTD